MGKVEDEVKRGGEGGTKIGVDRLTFSLLVFPSSRKVFAVESFDFKHNSNDRESFSFNCLYFFIREDRPSVSSKRKTKWKLLVGNSVKIGN